MRTRVITAYRRNWSKYLQVSVVKILDGHIDLESFTPFGFVLVVVDNGLVLGQVFSPSADRDHSLQQVPSLVADANRYLGMISLREFITLSVGQS